MRRGLGLLVGVSVALTPMAIAPAVAPAAPSAKHVLRALTAPSAKHVLRGRGDCKPTPPLPLLGGGGGRGYHQVDGLGSLLSRIIDAIADLLDGDGGPCRG